jgi:dihydrofolate reductase
LPFHSDSRAACIRETIEGADALLFGGNTYEMLAPYWSTQQTDENGPARALNSLPKYVVSTTVKESIWQNTEKIIGKNIEKEVADLKQKGEGYILISGSATFVASLMKSDLLDEFRLLVHPYVMNAGRRLFTADMPESPLELANSKQLDLGVLMLDYRVSRK